MRHVHRMATVTGGRSSHKLVARRRRQTGTVGPGTLGHLPRTAGTVVRTLGNTPLAALVDVELVLHHWHHESHGFVIFSVKPRTRQYQIVQLMLRLSITSLYTNVSLHLPPKNARATCDVCRIQEN